MPGGSKKSRFMQRCVADVTGQGRELGNAFAICTAQSQKAGYSEPGSTKQTGKGAAREKQFKKEPDMGKKAKAYERAVKSGRKSEDMATVFGRLDETAVGTWDAERVVVLSEKARDVFRELAALASAINAGDVLDVPAEMENILPRRFKMLVGQQQDIVGALTQVARSLLSGKWV